MHGLMQTKGAMLRYILVLLNKVCCACYVRHTELLDAVDVKTCTEIQGR